MALPAISPDTDPALAQAAMMPKIMLPPPMPDPGAPPPADMGAPPLPDVPELAPQPAAMPGASDQVQQDAAGLNAGPSPAHHQAMLHEFGAQKLANLGDRATLSVHDPDFIPKLMQSSAAYGKILHDEGQYKEMTPWGSPDSAHPGIGGKIGHALGAIGNVAGNAILGPQNMSLIPGSQANIHAEGAQGDQEIAGATKGLEENAQASNANATASEAPSKIALNEAQADKAGQDPASKPGTPDEQVLAAGQRIASGAGTKADLALIDSFHKLNEAKQAAKPVKPERPDTPEQQFIDSETSKGIPLEKAISDYARTSQAPQRQQQQLGVIDGKVAELRPGMSVPQGTESLTGNLKGAKPSADETRRADLARNMNENLDSLQEIAGRRPDLFGPIAGRATALRSTLGTSDPDIGALETIKEQMGMAMVGAHAMRNAGHVAAAANSILNGFHNDPNVLKKSIEEARKSLATFQQDAGEQPGSVPKHARTSLAPANPKPGDVIDGHRFRGGDPSKQANWEKVAQ